MRKLKDALCLRTPSERSQTDLAGIGSALELHREKSAEEKMHAQTVQLWNPDRCAVLQVVVSPEPVSASRSFFSSLARPASVPGRPAQPGMRAADRLRQLEHLLKDRLITQDEYVRRRRVILESL